MNQERGDLVATYVGLQGFEVVAVVHARHPRRGRVKVVRGERRAGQHECPDCGRRHAQALFEEPVPIWLRDCSVGDVETYLEVQPVRVACCVSSDTQFSAVRRHPVFRTLPPVNGASDSDFASHLPS